MSDWFLAGPPPPPRGGRTGIRRRRRRENFFSHLNCPKGFSAPFCSSAMPDLYLCICGIKCQNTKNGIASHKRGAPHRLAMEAKSKANKPNALKVFCLLLYSGIPYSLVPRPLWRLGLHSRSRMPWCLAGIGVHLQFGICLRRIPLQKTLFWMFISINILLPQRIPLPLHN